MRSPPARESEIGSEVIAVGDGANDDNGLAVASDGSGGCLVTGVFKSTVSFGTTSLTSAGDSDAFVMGVSGAGAVEWALRAGGTGVDRAGTEGRRQ